MQCKFQVLSDLTSRATACMKQIWGQNLFDKQHITDSTKMHYRMCSHLHYFRHVMVCLKFQTLCLKNSTILIFVKVWNLHFTELQSLRYNNYIHFQVVTRCVIVIDDHEASPSSSDCMTLRSDTRSPVIKMALMCSSISAVILRVKVPNCERLVNV